MRPFSPIVTLFLLIPFVLPLGLALDMYLPSMPSMSDALHTSVFSIQLTMSIFLYSFGIGQLILGPASDAWGRRKIILGSIGLFIAGSLFCTLATGIYPLLMGRVLQAFGACGMLSTTFALVRDYYDGKTATWYFTSLKGSMSLAPIIAPIIGAFLQIHYGWQATFITLTIYGFLMLLLGRWYLPHTTPKPQILSIKMQYIQPYKMVLKNRSFIYYCGCAIATQAATFGYFSLSPRYFMTHFGLSESQFALLFSMNAFAFLVTGFFAGKCIFWLGFRRSTLLSAILFTLSGLAMCFGHFTYDHYYNLFLPNLLASCSAAIMLGASTSGALMPFKHHAGAAAAMLGCTEFVFGGIIGSMVILGSTISVLPLAISLIVLGSALIICNLLFSQKIEGSAVTV